MKIIEYCFVFFIDNPDKFIICVNKKIKEGWQPFGSCNLDQLGGLAQVMVKYENPDDEDEEDTYTIEESKQHFINLSKELKARLDATLKNYDVLMKQKLEAFDEMRKYKREISELKKPNLVTVEGLSNTTAGFTHAIWKDDSIANEEIGDLKILHNEDYCRSLNEDIKILNQEIDYLKHKLDSDALLISELKKENEDLKYKLDGNSVLIESLQKGDKIYQSIIKDFIQKNIRLNSDMSCSVELDGNKFACTIVQKETNSTNLFNLIFNHYKNKASIWPSMTKDK